ncbi:MAG: FtsW/RodA/SpoVE family cell cycle protein [Clostridium sp.]|nr:FtsW/RodA/SpoVE family cell cycle protein [Clostridium sp.]
MADAPKKKKKKKPHRFYDYSLLLSVVFLTVFGLIMIYSASSYRAQLMLGDAAYFVKRQGMIAAAGAAAMLIISKIDYHWFAKFTWLAYGVSLACMVATMLFGVESHGKKRWLQIGPIQFQPTELVKISLILFLAVVISRMGLKVNEFRNVRAIIIWCGVPALLITENNLSSGIITCGIVFVVLFVACKIKWPFFACAGAGIGLIAVSPYIGKALVAVRLLKPYQLDRITAWVDPAATDTGYQTLQGLYAIGSGGFFGRGLGQSLQKLGFVPEPQNDMIFSIICEELGLFGATLLILMFMFMIYRFMVIASNAPDLMGSLIVVGVMAHIGIQVILNVAVVTNTIPNTGVTLPFISYGGTSVLFLMLEMGMVLSVSNQIKLEG